MSNKKVLRPKNGLQGWTNSCSDDVGNQQKMKLTTRLDTKSCPQGKNRLHIKLVVVVPTDTDVKIKMALN